MAFTEALDPRNRVYFCRREERPKQLPGSQIALYSLVGCWIIVLLALQSAGSLTGLSGTVAITLDGLFYVSLAVIAFYYVLLVWDRMLKAPCIPLAAPAGSRVVCICNERQQASILPLESGSFEPEVFNVSFAAAGLGGLDPFDLLCLVIAVLVGIAGGQLYPTSGSGPLNLMAYPLGFAAFVLLRAGLRPVHVRFVPGRMDIIVSAIAGLGRPKITSIDLTKVKVRVRMRDRWLWVTTPKGTDYAIYGWGLLSWTPMVRMLLQAATSTAKPPEPEQDELLQ